MASVAAAAAAAAAAASSGVTVARALADPALAQVFVDLRSRSAAVRGRAAKSLRAAVDGVTVDLKGDALSRYISEIVRRITQLTQSTEVAERLGGISAVDELIDAEGEEKSSSVPRYNNVLRQLLMQQDTETLVAAGKCLGHLARAGGAFASEWVEIEGSNAIKQLSDRVESRRIAALLILQNLALSAPTMFVPHIPGVFENIWLSLRDSRVAIRETAAETLQAVLSIVVLREGRVRIHWLHKLYEEACDALRGSGDALHGALLALCELFRCAPEMMSTKLREVADAALRLRDVKDRNVRRVVLALIPLLAASAREEFVRDYLNLSMQHLLNTIRASGTERAAAFVAVSDLARRVRSPIVSYVEGLVLLIKKEWSTRRGSQVPEAVECVGSLAVALGEELAPVFREQSLVDTIFCLGLNRPAVRALQQVAECVPSLLPMLQERLIAVATAVLQKHLPHSAPKSSGQASADEEALVCLTLETLANFNMRPLILTEFVKSCITPYLESESVNVRAVAASTCAKLVQLSSSERGGRVPTYGYTAGIVSTVLLNLLVLGVSDPEPRIRLTVLSSLHPCFDLHLAQADNLRALFVALNDEVFENRQVAIEIIGRLTKLNPAYVMPSLRKTLIQLLTELQFSADNRNKEESARLLGRLIRAANSLIRPYIAPVLKALTPHLSTGPSTVTARVLDAVADLACVTGDGLRDFVGELLPLVINSLVDYGSPAKREAALRAFAEVVSSTGMAVKPYLLHSDLMRKLLFCLRSENDYTIRRMAQVAIGTCGAIAPHRVAQLSSAARSTSSATDDSDRIPDTVLPGMGGANEEFYPAAALSALRRILRDPTLVAHHYAAAQSVMLIVRGLGTKTVSYLGDVMPPLLHVLQTCEVNLRELLLQQMAELVTVVRTHIRSYLPTIVRLIHDFWSPVLIPAMVRLIEEASRALADEFKTYLPDLIPQLLNVLLNDTSENKTSTGRVLRALEALGTNLDDYLYLVVPAVVGVAESAEQPMASRAQALITLGLLCRRLNVSDYAARIVHPIARILGGPYPDLRREAIAVLCALAKQLGADYAVFIPLISRVMSRQRMQHSLYEDMVHRIVQGESLPPLPPTEDAGAVPSATEGAAHKLTTNQGMLKSAWEGAPRISREDWIEWLRRFSGRLLSESPSPALRACVTLSTQYAQLSRDLFNASFVSCWGELSDKHQESLIHELENAFLAAHISPEVLQALLSLAEFMEHDEKPLPISIDTLGRLAEKCHAYAKALHYKEMEFANHPEASVEALISLNNKLQQPEAAVGILKVAREKYGVELKEAWYEKLRRWDDALAAYERRQASDRANADLVLGRMRCLSALGEWESLAALHTEIWPGCDGATRELAAPLLAAASFYLRRFDSLKEYTQALDARSLDGAWYRAVLAVRFDDVPQARTHIETARSLLDSELSALIGDGYRRAYRELVVASTLVELEEVITFRQSEPAERERIRAMWTSRLGGMQRSVEVWQRVLAVRSLVMPPTADPDAWVRFASLCRKSERPQLAVRALASLLEVDVEDIGRDDTLETAQPRVAYACIKHLWHVSLASKDSSGLSAALSKMRSFASAESESSPALAARAHLRLAQWTRSVGDVSSEQTFAAVLSDSAAAAELDPQWWKAWHEWALVAYHAVSTYAHQKGKVRELRRTVEVAVRAFIHAIALADVTQTHILQDTLRLLTLWFAHGSYEEVEAALKVGFKDVPPDTWLKVIPQIIARIHTRSETIRRMVHELLIMIGRRHPQALVYPLTVSAKSNSAARRDAAMAILSELTRSFPKLFEQASTVSAELIRVAVLWHEMWHDALDEACRLYYSELDVRRMYAHLGPLHDMMRKGPETMREASFRQAYGRDLADAEEWLRKYMETGEKGDINQAWDMYYQVFRKISKQLPQLTTLDLHYVSPKLLEAHDLELAIPGSYVVGQDVVHIKGFSPTLQVMLTKQRPRKIVMYGDDGREYMFLLKGHEDLRQDERAMQLSGLVNTLLASDTTTRKRDLEIQRYSVIPLTPNSGLLSWVPHCDTIHDLVKEYRESRRVQVTVEPRVITQMTSDYEKLPVINKLEVFEHTLASTSGTDLCNVLWLKSRNSEIWLDRRTNYTRSLAVMSMVGYILGLGDRHPSNLMLDRYSGKVTHIDFGDCFDVAMHRDKYPERVPFRLTRMLINAMEVSGIEGNFRVTCENVMGVIRKNADSVMAMLEAFVYDPLINWRLVSAPARQAEGGAKRAAAQASEGASKLAKAAARQRDRVDGSLERERVAAVDDEESEPTERTSARALEVTEAVQRKLTGRDFGNAAAQTVSEQVGRLIWQATSNENLCQMYSGWCPFW